MHRIFSLRYFRGVRRRTGLILRIRFRGADLLPILAHWLFTLARWALDIWNLKSLATVTGIAPAENPPLV